MVELDTLERALDALTANRTTTAMSDVYSDSMQSALRNTEVLAEALATTELKTAEFEGGGLASQLERAARLLAYNAANGTERVALSASQGGWDSHGTFDLAPKYAAVDDALRQFVRELKANDLWDNVVIVFASEFGRSLRPNGAGTDHAWGGNAWIAGGAVKGGRILGAYPNKMTEDGDQVIGKGRMLPTKSWEAMWYGIAQWMGVDDKHMADVLPNAANFPESELFGEKDLFE